MSAAIVLSLAGTALDRGAFAAPFTVPNAPDTVLFDQLTTCNLNGSHSQIFEAANAMFDSAAADDFDVPANATWEINQVWASGGYDHGFGPAPYVSVTFYGPGGSVPGASIAQCSYDNVDTFTDSIGRFTIALPRICELWGGSNGKNYWVSVRARMDFAAGGEWAWQGSNPQHGNAAQWQNPANGFSTNCITWSGIPGCIAGAAPDLCFAINGTIGNDILFQNGFETF